MDKQLKSLLKSILYAFGGLWYAIRTQRNMRIHLTAAVGVLWLSWYFPFSSGDYVSLMVTIGMVISAELVNTAIEAALDRQSRHIDRYAKIAKDTAAAAVLICAVASLGVAGVLFFGSPQGFVEFYKAYCTSLWGILILVAAIGMGTAFVFVPPDSYCNPERRKMKL